MRPAILEELTAVVGAGAGVAVIPWGGGLHLVEVLDRAYAASSGGLA